jgi:transposase
MIDRHWDGISAYCKPENKVALGFVEGLTTKSASFNAAPTACATRNISN